MSDTTSDIAASRYIAREVVGGFADAASLDRAIAELAVAGIDRAAISVLDSDAEQQGATAASLRSAWALSDDPKTPQSSFVSVLSRREAVAVAVPMEIAGLGTAWAVAATGGALLLAIGATVAAGAVAAGLGALVYRVVADRHAAVIQAQIAQGGLILCIPTR